MKRLLRSAAVLLVLVGAGCGSDDDNEAGVEVGDAPGAGNPSAQFKVPLPDGAVAEPASAAGGGEAYRVPAEDASLLDVNAFYEEQADGRPLADFTWCGGAGYPDNRIVRIWKKSETHQLQLELVGQENGVLIRVREDSAAQPTTCPPSPAVEQPFEGPQ